MTVDKAEWSSDWEKTLIWAAACTPLLKDFPGSLDEALFGGPDSTGAGMTRSPAQHLVGGILVYLKKRKEFPGPQMAKVLVEKIAQKANKAVSPLILKYWQDVVAHNITNPLDYGSIKAIFPGYLHKRVSTQLMIQEAQALDRMSDGGLDHTEYEAQMTPLRLRKTTLLANVEIKPRSKRIKAAEFEPSSVDWLVNGMLPRGMYCVLSGFGGIGKTLVALEIAKGVLTGNPILGHWTVNPGKVCLLMLDDPGSLIKDRLNLMGIKDHPDLDLITELADPLRPLDTLKDFLWWHENGEYTADLIIVDALMNVTPIGENKANDQGTMMPVFDVLNAIADRTGATVLLIAHLNKGGLSVSGSHVAESAAKVVLKFSKPPKKKGEDEPDKHARILHQTKNKMLGEFEWAIRNEGVGRLEFVGSGMEKQAQDVRDRILGFFAELPKVNIREIDPETGELNEELIEVHGRYLAEEIFKYLHLGAPSVIPVLDELRREGKLEKLQGKRTGKKSERAKWLWQLPGTPEVQTPREKAKAFFSKKNGHTHT